MKNWFWLTARGFRTVRRHCWRIAHFHSSRPHSSPITSQSLWSASALGNTKPLFISAQSSRRPGPWNKFFMSCASVPSSGPSNSAQSLNDVGWSARSQPVVFSFLRPSASTPYRFGFTTSTVLVAWSGDERATGVHFAVHYWAILRHCPNGCDQHLPDCTLIEIDMYGVQRYLSYVYR